MNKYEIIFKSNLSWEGKIKMCERLCLHEVQKSINNNIKNALPGQTVWTEFEGEYKDVDANWGNNISYYYSDLTTINFTEDWRTCEVKGRRKQRVCNGLVLHEEKNGLKQNNIKDYIKYLDNVKHIQKR